MAMKTRTLNIRVTESQYNILEDLVKKGEYTSKGEFIRELLRERFDDFSVYLHKKAKKERAKHVSLEEYGRSRGLE